MADYDLDRLLEDAIPFGRYQRFFYFLFCIPAMFTAAVTMSSVFTSATPAHRCFITECDNTEGSPVYQDAFTKGFANFSIPSNANSGFSKCQHFASKNSSLDICSADSFRKEVKLECKDWVYDESSLRSTLVTEWNLVCDDSYKAPLSQSMFFAGVLFGALAFGVIADKFGRKLALMSGIFLMSFGSIAMGLSSSYGFYLAAQFVAAAGQVGAFQSSFILGVESVGKEYRVFCGIVIEYFFVAGEALMALVAYLTGGQWRLILLISMSPSVGLLFLWPYLPESVRWQIGKGKMPEAQKEVDRICRWNSVTPELQLPNYKREEENAENVRESNREENRG